MVMRMILAVMEMAPGFARTGALLTVECALLTVPKQAMAGL
jgi:hypothetical protein